MATTMVPSMAGSPSMVALPTTWKGGMGGASPPCATVAMGSEASRTMTLSRARILVMVIPFLPLIP